jgi:hypothetical protein
MKWLVLISAFFFLTPLKAQDTDSTIVEEATLEDFLDGGNEYDSAPSTVEPERLESSTHFQSEKITRKKFDESKWKEIVGSTDYEEKPRKEAPDTTPVRERSQPIDGTFIRVLAYAAITAVFVLLLYYVIKNTSVRFKPKTKSRIKDDLEKPLDNIEDFDSHSLVDEAIAQGNFRLAVRLYYLGLLKKLNEAGVIKWKKDKTNRDYLSEIFSSDFFYDDIRKLTIAYEHVWYGQHTTSEASFRTLFAKFETMSEKLNTTKTS